MRCPACRSRDPKMHPATQSGGEVVHICRHPFHDPASNGCAPRPTSGAPGFLMPARTYYPRNMANRVGVWFGGDNGEFLSIDPYWTDETILVEWADQMAIDPFPTGTKVIRHTWHRYSARQRREEQPEHDDYWGEDGELATWIMVAEIGRIGPPSEATTPPADYRKNTDETGGS